MMGVGNVRTQVQRALGVQLRPGHNVAFSENEPVDRALLSRRAWLDARAFSAVFFVRG
jgi:hypothetical protein